MSGRQNWLRSWKFVSWRSAVVAAVVVYGLAGFFVVPWIAKKLIVDIASERTGREVTVEKVRCNPLTLSLTIEGQRADLVCACFASLHARSGKFMSCPARPA